MNFKQAYSKLLEGKTIRRTSWDKNYYICMKNKLIYDAIGDTTKPITNIDLDSALADDWEVIEKKVWKPQKEERYYFIKTGGVVCHEENCNIYIDIDRFNIGNCFKTEEEAKHMVEKLKVIKELRDFAIEHNTKEIDWNDEEQAKHVFHCCLKNKQIYFTGTYQAKESPLAVYFTSEELAKQAIEKIGEERIKRYYFDIKEK